MTFSRRIPLLAVPLLLAAGVAALWVLHPVEVQTSLYDLVGEGAAFVPASVRQASSDLVPVLVSADDPARARTAVTNLRAALRQDAAVGGDAPLQALAQDRYGLAALDDVRLLMTPDGRARLARKALRRHFSSPLPPLFDVREDPFFLADGFVRALANAQSGWKLSGGVLEAERRGRTFFFLPVRLRPETLASPARLEDFRVRLKDRMNAVSVDGVFVVACGVPLHTAIAASACRREINALSVFSLVFIALLALFAFRGVRVVPLLALSLAVSAMAGALALLALFPAVHVMTLVMGTTVLGLVIDYSFHWLCSGGGKSVVRNLALSCFTTEIALLPLMFSALPVLRQSAVFLGVGLAAVFSYVVGCYPRGAAHVGRDPATLRAGVRWGLVLIGLVSAAGLFRFTFGTDLTALYRPPAELKDAERLFAELSGADDPMRGFLLFDRQAIAADIRRLYDEQGESLRETLGLGERLMPPAETSSGEYAVPARPPEAGTLPSGVRFCPSPRQVLEGTLAQWTCQTALRLVLALGLMALVLFAFFRRRGGEMMMPSVVALVAVAGFLGLADVSLNLFHLLACFLLVGMGVDYTVFLHAGGKGVLRPALLSLLTSVAGFGALVFVSFPVVQSFGIVLGLGLPVAFLTALATVPCGARSVEVAATPFGMEILWCLYRVFGLRTLHGLAALLGTCVWLSSAAVRRATPFAKLVHFTRSLADKFVIMAEGRVLPPVATDGSPDAAAFVSDVRAGRGVFVLSSHCGTVEALAALGRCACVFHAWMDFDRTSAFNRFYLRHARRRQVVIHPISEIGLETSFLAGDALDRGDCLVMAGDRGRGAFRFAHAMGHPVYFAACVWNGRGYIAIVRRLRDGTKAMEEDFHRCLDETAGRFPDQHFEWGRT